MQKLTRLNSLVGHLIFISTDTAQWQLTMFLSCFQVWPWTIGMWPQLELQAENMHMADAIARVSWNTENKEQQLEKIPHKRNSIVFCAILRDVAISVHPRTVILIGLIKKKQLLRMMPCNMNKKNSKQTSKKRLKFFKSSRKFLKAKRRLWRLLNTDVTCCKEDVCFSSWALTLCGK